VSDLIWRSRPEIFLRTLPPRAKADANSSDPLTGLAARPLPSHGANTQRVKYYAKTVVGVSLDIPGYGKSEAQKKITFKTLADT
jgi:hypothetical protein